MDTKRKKKLRAKGAIVAWTCATDDGLAHLLYLKNLGNNKYCLVREALLDEGDKKIAPQGRNWVIESEAKMGLFIMSLTNMLRMRTIALAKYYLVGIKEAVGKGRKKITLQSKGLKATNIRKIS